MPRRERERDALQGRARRPRPNAAAQRAVQAATPREPWLPPGYISWALTRALGLVIMLLAGWVVYDSASSDRFGIRAVHIRGTVLLSPTDIESAAAVTGANAFWVDRAEVARRVRSLPLVQRVEITTTLPDTLDISVVERQPAAFWISGDSSYLVDAEGVILKPVDADTQQARACAGQPCDPRLASLPTVSQVAGARLSPGDRVDVGALATSARLATLLPTVGIEPLAFEWTPDNGIEVPTRDGWRARFDGQANVDTQITSLRAVRDQLVRTRTQAELIDVRFGDRPYFR